MYSGISHDQIPKGLLKCVRTRAKELNDLIMEHGLDQTKVSPKRRSPLKEGVRFERLHCIFFWGFLFVYFLFKTARSKHVDDFMAKAALTTKVFKNNSNKFITFFPNTEINMYVFISYFLWSVVQHSFNTFFFIPLCVTSKHLNLGRI